MATSLRPGFTHCPSLFCSYGSLEQVLAAQIIKPRRVAALLAKYADSARLSLALARLDTCACGRQAHCV